MIVMMAMAIMTWNMITTHDSDPEPWWQCKRCKSRGCKRCKFGGWKRYNDASNAPWIRLKSHRSSNASTFQKTALIAWFKTIYRFCRNEAFSWKNLTPTLLQDLVLPKSHCHDCKCHTSRSNAVIDIFNVEYSKCKRPRARRIWWIFSTGELKDLNQNILSARMLLW